MRRWKRAGIKFGAATLAGLASVIGYGVRPHLLLAVTTLACFLGAAIWFVAYVHAFCTAATRVDRGRVSDPAPAEWYQSGRYRGGSETDTTDGERVTR